MTNEILAYLIILDTMREELLSEEPNLTALQNCRLFLAEAPLPSSILAPA